MIDFTPNGECWAKPCAEFLGQFPVMPLRRDYYRLLTSNSGIIWSGGGNLGSFTFPSIGICSCDLWLTASPILSQLVRYVRTILSHHSGLKWVAVSWSPFVVSLPISRRSRNWWHNMLRKVIRNILCHISDHVSLDISHNLTIADGAFSFYPSDLLS